MPHKETEHSKMYSKDNFPIVFSAIRVVFAALLLAEISVFVIYSFIEPSALVKRMVITGIVCTIVSFPIAYYVYSQNKKLGLATKRLAYLVKMDQMSGLFNRTAFFKQVSQHLCTPLAGASSGCLLYIDADNFKELNDNCGHDAGDNAIREIAQIISNTQVEEAIAGRLGGEEFALFLPKVNIKRAKTIAENIRREVRKLIYENGSYSQRLSVSIGGALHTTGQSIDDLVRCADERMYFAKGNGRNQVAFDLPETADDDLGQDHMSATG